MLFSPLYIVLAWNNSPDKSRMHKFVTCTEIIVCVCLGWDWEGEGSAQIPFLQKYKNENGEVYIYKYLSGLSENRIIHRLNSCYYIYILGN